MTARPPARTILEPVPDQATDSTDLAVGEIVDDARLEARVPRAGRGLERSAQSAEPAAGERESRPREPPRLRPPPAARVDPVAQEHPSLILPLDDHSPTTARPGLGAPIPVEGRIAPSAPVAHSSARAEPAQFPQPAGDAPVEHPTRGAIPDDAPRTGDAEGGIRPAGNVRSRVSPVGVPIAPPAAPPAQPTPQTVVRVSIGRVEVRAAAPATTPAAQARPAPATPRLTLDAFLERAGERRRR
jgi:hypothetical protein